MRAEELRALAARVGGFHVTDAAMKRAQSRIERALEAGQADARAAAEYVEAVRRYFSGFSREARAHLRDVDRRLEQVNQVRFNLSAERAVAVKRIDATQAVLDAVEALSDRASA